MISSHTDCGTAHCPHRCLQKFFDQAISGNWSYNPLNYPDNEIPVSVWVNDLLTTYKYGWKTSYYQNTYDLQKEEEVIEEKDATSIQAMLEELLDPNYEEEDCDSCKI